MPINKPVTYAYRAAYPAGVKPFMPTYESYRSRREIGGTFIRAKDPGEGGNQISVEFITSGENVTMVVNGPVKIPLPTGATAGTGAVVNINAIHPPVFETFTLVAIDKDQFTVTGSVSGNIGIATVGRPFAASTISFMVINGDVDFIVGDTFTVDVPDPKETYTATGNVDQNVTNPDPAAPTIPSPSYSQLRSAVNTQSKLIQMSDRGWDYVDNLGTDPRTGRSVRPEGTTPVDGPLIPSTLPTYLVGGQGFPSSPIGIYTGVERTLIHINRGETDNGDIKEINRVYEWDGSSATSGSFSVYV